MDTNMFSVSMENNGYTKDMDDLDDNFDAFNDETFGDMSTDWDEGEHQKMLTMTSSDSCEDSNQVMNKNTFVNNSSYNDYAINDDLHLTCDDILAKSISNLGLEDEDFDDPAIMTFSRSAKPMPEPTDRYSHSPPPPAILSYEEYSASPQTSTIWSTSQLDSTVKSTMSTTSVVNMRTLEEVENDLIIRKTNDLHQLTTIKKSINLEDLEKTLIDESIHKQVPPVKQNLNVSHLTSNSIWSPFTNDSSPNILSNGTIDLNKAIRIEDIENIKPKAPLNHNNIDIDAIHAAARLALNDSQEQQPLQSIDPLLKAQTLSDIERQLITGPQSPPKVTKLQQNMSKLEPIPPEVRTNTVLNNQTPNKSLSQFRPQMMVQNRPNNMFMRPPMMPLLPSTHPSMTRPMYPPALMPNNQRLYPYPRPPIMHPMLHPLQIQHLNQQQLRYLQQQQQQHFIHHMQRQNYRNNDSVEDVNDYSGLMTKQEKDWLIKIQQMQTELKDPYVDDYYYVTYISRKIAAKAANDKTTPKLVIPERPKPTPESEKDKYMPEQFAGTLGKIQVSNVNRPRQLLDGKFNKTDNSSDANSDKPMVSKSEVQRFRKLLLQIERLYVVLINIDDEDKRIGALPPEARIPHLETRKQLCDKLFKGLTNVTNDKINAEVAQIRKGLILLFRSLSYFSDDYHKAIIMCDIFSANNYKQYIIKSKDRHDFVQLLLNGISSVTNHEVILKLISNVNNNSSVTQSEYGKLIEESLNKHNEKLELNGQFNN
ncbi:protein PAT1 homolog 1-like [Oppia nitens]|uniref:protein PAT1 homolog 1-like n=1 Tax=Oppia nitens TaxID=1686743 RepID=UPI0023D97ABF|nr:protein PAT1 homolog 1-like [Oppia nitens]